MAILMLFIIILDYAKCRVNSYHKCSKIYTYTK